VDRRSFLQKHPVVTAFAIAFGVSLAVLSLRAQGWLQPLELVAFDHYVGRMPGRQDGHSRIALVEVSEQDIQKLGKYPIPDGEMARAITYLSEAGARGIGIDIYRDIPVPPGSAQLEAVLTGSPRVIVPSKFADEGHEGVGPPKVLAGSAQVGFNNMVKDEDGKVRRGLLYMEDGQGGMGTSISFLLAMHYLGDEEIYPEPDPDDPSVLKLGASSFQPLVSDFGGYAKVDTGGYQYPLDYRGVSDSFPTANFTDVLSGEADPELFRDRIVMIGVTAESLTDRFHIPFVSNGAVGVEIPGAALHGRLADQLIRQALGETQPMRSTTALLEALMVLTAGTLAAALMLWMRTGWGLLALGLGGLFGLYWSGWEALLGGLWLPVVPPGLAWVSSLTVVAAYSRSRERADRAELMNLFSRHVTKSVADDVWQNRDAFLEGGRPKPVRLTATILFIDIRGYTGNAEKLDPAELMQWIDSFLGAMAEQVLERGGMVEDYFGDGMMACYGIPIPATDDDGIRRNAVAAVKSALGMQHALHALNEEWADEGRPAAGIRVGVATGVVVAGSMGSADRLKYGVVGDAVVTAQRLESLGLDRVDHDFEENPARILINAATNAQLDSSFRTECVGEFLVKGKNEPVTVYRVHGRTENGEEAAAD
jgi:adenylate cyclase